MKRLVLAVTVASVLALAAGGVLAGEGQEAPKKPRKKRPAPKVRKPVLRGMQAEIAKVCALSEEQQKQIHQINADRGKAFQEFNKANAEKIKAANEDMKKAREAKDKEAMKKAYEAQGAIRAEQAQISKKFEAQVMDVLTDEQKDTWAKHVIKRDLKRRYPKFEFTDEQVAQVKAARAKAYEGVDRSDRKAASKARYELDTKIRNEILTPDQRATLALGSIVRQYTSAKVTDEQKAQIKAAYIELAKDVNLADRKAADKFRRGLDAKIRNEILTPDQRAALAMRWILGRYRGVAFTDEQKEQIKAAYIKLAEGKDLTDRKLYYKLQADLRAQISKEILTDEQKLTLAVAGVTGRYRRAKLTDDQVTQIKTAYAKHMTGVKGDDRKAKADAVKKLHEEITTQILTEEQREAIKPKPRPKKTEK